MLVYGDPSQTASPARLLSELEAALDASECAPANARHDLLVRAFIKAAGLAQGLIDAEFEARGLDDVSPLHMAALDLVLAIARGLITEQPAGRAQLARLAAAALPPEVRVKTPEGYAFYAVYPEAYLRAAGRHPWCEPPLVIGLRSIGTGLGALVAAAAGAERVVTLRPVGHPFARELRPSPALLALLQRHTGPFAIVDEGPGLSGSSFGCVADLLDALGVAADRVVFFPSHANDLGLQASPRHRARWRAAARPSLGLDDLLAEEPISDWFSEDIGPVTRVEDLSGGAWRPASSGVADWPPINPMQERRKFRLTSAEGQWLAKFAGLGAYGEAKQQTARALHSAGFAPEPVALRRGFLLQRWETGCRLSAADLRTPAFLDHLAAYLGFRARHFPVAGDQGASLETLFQMTKVNSRDLLGDELGEELVQWLLAHRPEGRSGPSALIDAKLQPWEWLRRPDGGFCKLDALDHARSHDLVGCQEIIWDVAGAAVELGLGSIEREALCARVSQIGGVLVDHSALPFYSACYAAFHGGAWAMAEGSTAGAGAHHQRRFYQQALAALAGVPQAASLLSPGPNCRWPGHSPAPRLRGDAASP